MLCITRLQLPPHNQSCESFTSTGQTLSLGVSLQDETDSTSLTRWAPTIAFRINTTLGAGSECDLNTQKQAKRSVGLDVGVSKVERLTHKTMEMEGRTDWGKGGGGDPGKVAHDVNILTSISQNRRTAEDGIGRFANNIGLLMVWVLLGFVFCRLAKYCKRL